MIFSEWTLSMNIFDIIPPQWLDAIGVAGFGLYVLNYSLLTCHRLSSNDVSYFALNLLASCMVLAGLVSSFNRASALIQIFWICISVVAIFLRLRPKWRHLVA